MTPEQFRRVEDLFFELQPLGPEQRGTALASACADDPVVRAEVERLLHEQASSAGDDLSRLGRDFTQAVAEEVTRQLVGRQVGPYEVIDRIGQGGMGVIYLGRDRRLDRLAALKAVLPGAGPAGARVERLRREARVLASISHPNIATVYGLEEAHGTLFLAMEHIEGKTLSQRLVRNALPPGEALAVCEQIAAGVEAAHDAGVIHRDLKPGNVMFTPDGTVKVLDFGLARELPRDGRAATPGGDSRDAALTRQGSLFGTPAYMSPEQARGEPLDRRSDIFSFGTILFRCLTGRPAFQGETDLDLIDAILNGEPDWSLLPAGAPPQVERLLRRCLAKNPADRYRHVGDVRLDLREAMVARPTAAGADDGAGRPSLVRRVLPWLLAGAATAAAVTIAVVRPPRSGAQVPSASSTAEPQRFDMTFPESALQKDLERLQLALSRDGRYFVVACQTAAGQELWIRSHADFEWRRLPGTIGGHRPFLSPDGTWVGFYRDGNLFKRRLSGGEPIRLATATNWYGASWGEDGSILYAPGWGTPLAGVEESGGEPNIFTHLDDDRGEVSHVNPLVLPGGRFVLYSVWTGGEHCEIHATDLKEGYAEHTVLAGASTPRVAPTPRGDYLLFERASMIFAAPFDASTARVTGPESPVAEAVMNDGTRFAAYFDVAADGTLAYVPGSAFAEESRLAWVNANGTTTPFNDERLSFAEPNFSADGSKLAVSEKGKVYRTLVYDLERNTRQYVVTGGDTVGHALSPDGQTIACTVNRDGGYGIDLISLADGSRRRVVQPGADYQSDLDWSDDGRWLVYSMSPRDESPRDVRILDLQDGGPDRPLVATPAADTHPSISPDSRWVAYASSVSGRPEVYLVDCPSGERTRQVSLRGGECPSWSPDGKVLYYVAPEGLVCVSISPDGSPAREPTLVFDQPFGQSDPIARNYTIAPTGRPLIVEPSERRPSASHLHVITNWYQLLK